MYLKITKLSYKKRKKNSQKSLIIKDICSIWYESKQYLYTIFKMDVHIQYYTVSKIVSKNGFFFVQTKNRSFFWYKPKIDLYSLSLRWKIFMCLSHLYWSLLSYYIHYSVLNTTFVLNYKIILHFFVHFY